MQEERILKAAGAVGLATTLSRIFGYFRDASLAWILGAGFGMDVFTVAYRLANLFRRLVAEGAMSTAFIPVFVQFRTEHSAKELWDFARKGFYTLALAAGSIVALEILFAPWIVRLMAPGFGQVEGKYEFTVLLTRVLAPYLILISSTAFLTGVLNSFGHFLIPALSPVCFNLAVIASAFSLGFLTQDPALGIACGVLIGGALQFLIQLPRARACGMNFRPAISFKHPAIRKMGVLLMPSIFGMGVVQLNLLVDSLMASFLREGSVSQIYYADRVMELVLGIFVLSLATVLLPELARFAAEKKIEELKASIQFSLRTISLVAVPATVGLFVLADPIIHVLFERGRFTSLDTERTAAALAFYAIGLFFISAVRVVVSAFYSVQDTKTPVKAAFVSLGVNFILNWILMQPLKQGGIALATSIASAVNFFQLIFVFQKKYGSFDWGPFRKSVLKIAAASAVMGLWSLAMLYLFRFNPSQPFPYKAAMLFGIIGLSMVIYGAICLLLRSEEILLFKKVGFKREKAD